VKKAITILRLAIALTCALASFYSFASCQQDGVWQPDPQPCPTYFPSAVAFAMRLHDVTAGINHFANTSYEGYYDNSGTVCNMSIPINANINSADIQFGFHGPYSGGTGYLQMPITLGLRVGANACGLPNVVGGCTGNLNASLSGKMTGNYSCSFKADTSLVSVGATMNGTLSVGFGGIPSASHSFTLPDSVKTRSSSIDASFEDWQGNLSKTRVVNFYTRLGANRGQISETPETDHVSSPPTFCGWPALGSDGCWFHIDNSQVLVAELLTNNFGFIDVPDALQKRWTADTPLDDDSIVGLRVGTKFFDSKPDLSGPGGLFQQLLPIKFAATQSYQGHTVNIAGRIGGASANFATNADGVKIINISLTLDNLSARLDSSTVDLPAKAVRADVILGAPSLICAKEACYFQVKNVGGAIEIGAQIGTDFPTFNLDLLSPLFSSNPIMIGEISRQFSIETPPCLDLNDEHFRSLGACSDGKKDTHLSRLEPHPAFQTVTIEPEKMRIDIRGDSFILMVPGY
jgi:hypothetical protein